MSLKVLICSTHHPKNYSGGRYHSWVLGESLVAKGHEVVVWTNCTPKCSVDFNYLNGKRTITLVKRLFYLPHEIDFDWVIIVPDLGSCRSVYKIWLSFAQKCKAHLSMINFETPNFFNEYSQRDPSLWENWKYVSRYCDSIISSSKISSEYAKKFFTDAPQYCHFQVCEPTINCFAADRVGSQQRRKQIFVISRFGDFSVHKAGDLLTNILVPEMMDFELILLGGKKIADSLRQTIEEKCNDLGIHLTLLGSISDEDKFKIIKSSKFTLFLSRFEGFGYPPVESLYCNTPCLASDLPVLREISGNGLIYLKNDNLLESKKLIKAWCYSDLQETNLRKFVSHVCGFQIMGDKLITNYEKIYKNSNIIKYKFVPMIVLQLQVFTCFLRNKFTVKYLKDKFHIKSYTS